MELFAQYLRTIARIGFKIWDETLTFRQFFDRSIILVLVKHQTLFFRVDPFLPTLPEEPAPILNSRAIPVTRITVSFSTVQQLCIHLRDDG